MTDISELIERLRYFEDCDVPDGSGSGSTITARWYRNVDGPEAATALETLQAENERMREALEPFVDLKAQNGAWGIIENSVRGMEPVTVTVTKAQMLALARQALGAKP